MINKIFENIGMSNREASIYLACLRLISPTIADLQKHTKLSRSTIYYSIDLLMKNHIIFSKKIDNQTIYEAASPDELKKIVETRMLEIRNNVNQFEKIIPDLKQYSKSGKFNLRMVKGLEAYTKVLRESYSKHKNSTVKVFSTIPSQSHDNFVKKSFKNSINYRVENKVFLKGISPITTEKWAVRDKDKEQLRKSRFLPKDKFNFESEIYIFDDVVLVVTNDIENEVYAIYFDDMSYVKTMNMIFDLSWEVAEKYDKKVVAEYEKANSKSQISNSKKK